MADISERTMWKDDLHGLLLGASLVDLENRDSEDEVMRTLRKKIASTIWKHEWVMFAYDPGVSTDPLEVQFLNVLSTMKQPRRVLEIGVFTGYGAATMLKGCENVTLVSPEIDSFLKPWVRDGLASMPNPSTRREIEVGHALDTLEKLPSSEAFDVASLDANKRVFKRYTEVLIAQGLLDKNTTTTSVTASPSCRIDVSSDAVSLRKRADVNPLGLWTKRSWAGPEFEKRTAQFVSLSKNDRHEQQHGCEVTLPSPPNSLVSMTRSNTCQNQVLTRNVFFSCSSQSSPSIRYTSLLQRWRKPEQQSNEHFVDIADNNEKNDDVLEENNSKIYVKTINKKTISICYYDSMKAAVILEEVERRTAIPRDMTRLTHKGKDINEKKSMKDNNIDTNETIEMSMRLLGGMEVNEQINGHTRDR